MRLTATQSWMPTLRRFLETGVDIDSGSKFGDVDLPRVLPIGQVDEIWFLDDYHHGQSIDLNSGSIGSVHSWLDGGRDVLNFVKHVLPAVSVPDGETLSWRESDNTQGRSRRVIGLGHSVGGNAMCVTDLVIRHAD